MTTKESARKFQFLREIASGGFGSVYLAKVTHADGFSRLVAVKLLHRRWSENEEIASRMRDEARLLGWLRHRNIVDVMDLTLIDGRCAVVMEYLEAVDTRVIIESCRTDGLRVPLGVVLEIGAAVSSALDAAYNRPPYAGEKPLHVIHRDIKPSNVMVDEQGIVKVLDFGVARAEFDAREAKTAELSFGSLEYMPPERLFFEPESPASDIYSLGTTLYEILTLEKLGKAKLRESEQQKFVEQRFEDLLERYPLPSQEVEDLLRELFRDMLAFDESDRPSAADCVTRMRSFARKLGGEPLELWAEKNIPTLISLVRDRDEGDGATLTGKVVSEDISGFWEDSTMGGEDDASDGHVVPADLPDDPNDPQDSTEFTVGRDDERWSALKEATLASLSETGELSHRTIEEVRRVRPMAVAEWLADDATDSDDGLPTVRIPMGADEATPEAMQPVVLDGWARPNPPLVGTFHQDDTVALRTDLPPMAPPPAKRATPSLPPPEPADEGASWSGVLLSLLLLVGVGVLVAVVVVIVGGAAVAALLSQPGQPSIPVPAPPPVVTAPTASEPPEPVPADALPEGAATFVSMMPDTTKLVVRCQSGTFSGATEALVEGAEGLGECTVTAVDASRKRRTAVISKTEPRRYVCFTGDGSDCR